MSTFPAALPAPREIAAVELFNLLEAGIIERYMLSDEQRARVDAYEKAFDDYLESQIGE